MIPSFLASVFDVLCGNVQRLCADNVWGSHGGRFADKCYREYIQNLFLCDSYIGGLLISKMSLDEDDLASPRSISPEVFFKYIIIGHLYLVSAGSRMPSTW